MPPKPSSREHDESTFTHTITQLDDGATEFRAERVSLDPKAPHNHMRSHSPNQSHDEGGGGHGGGTEMGWLVSYADMMTLLFGLFVILFTLMVQSPAGSADQVMKEVSKQYFGGTIEKPNQSPPGYPTPVPSPSDTPAPTPAVVDAIDPKQYEAAQAKITGLEKKVTDLQKQVDLKEQAKTPASGEPMRSKVDAKKRIASLEKTVQEMQSQASQLEQKLIAQKSINEKLSQEIEKEKSKTPMQNYMATMLVWDTEKHDLDLTIVDPDGKVFDFKHRSFPKQPGRFELDSRFGPGIEMWKSENFRPGKYKARIRFYGNNGNKAKPVAHLTVVTNLSTYQSPPLDLKNVGDQKEITFTVDDTGAVHF